MAEMPAQEAPVLEGANEDPKPVEGNEEPQEGTEETPAEPKVYDEDYVKELRKESANYRTQLREAQDKLSKAKTAEEFDQVRTELESKINDLETAKLKSDIALEFKLPAAAAKRLSGSTKEELEQDAQELLALFGQAPAPKTPRTPRGGLDPSDEAGPIDPAAVKAEMRKNRVLGGF